MYNYYLMPYRYMKVKEASITITIFTTVVTVITVTIVTIVTKVIIVTIFTIVIYKKPICYAMHDIVK